MTSGTGRLAGVPEKSSKGGRDLIIRMVPARKTVKIRRGPATVCEDEARNDATGSPVLSGRLRAEDDSRARRPTPADDRAPPATGGVCGSPLTSVFPAGVVVFSGVFLDRARRAH